ncbi:MAG: outer membrane protein assembly factor [Acidobacteriota bacterium]|nr:outer membrane protein assembly factor [Acidobacteriota bacterium]
MLLRKLSICFAAAALSVCAQDAAPADTRAGQIEAARQAKAAAIQPEKPASLVGKSESIFSKAFKVWNVSRVGEHGLSLRLGGLPDGSGLALGPDYVFKMGELYNPDLIWDSYVVGSLQGYYRAQTGIELPRLLNEHAFVSATAFRFDFPRLAYYGEGPDTRETGRTDYRMQENQVGVRGGFRLSHSLRAGAEGSFQSIDIRRGTAPGIAQTASTYQIPVVEGQARNANFFLGGFFLQYDSRDAPLNPRAGTYLSAEFQNVNGNPSRLGEFNRYDLEAQQYFHFWNKRRVIAARVKSSLTTPHAGSGVPFYLEPSLGGSSDLRGFRPYRFYDRNSVVATVEYRWTVMQVLDMALFGDAGKVYHDASTFSLTHMQTDIGLGLRAKVGDNVPFRIDIGCSREGVQVWLNFYNVF